MAAKRAEVLPAPKQQDKRIRIELSLSPAEGLRWTVDAEQGMLTPDSDAAE